MRDTFNNNTHSTAEVPGLLEAVSQELWMKTKYTFRINHSIMTTQQKNYIIKHYICKV